MRRTGLAIAALCAGGCAGPVMLSDQASAHERRAQIAAEKGDGAKAQRERQRASDLRESARLNAHRRGGWVWRSIMVE